MKRTKQMRWLRFGLLATLILTLTACGGGGGGGDETPTTPAPPSTPTTPTAASATVVVGGRAGSATQLSSLLASARAAGAIKAAAGDIDPALANAKVTLEVIKADGTTTKYYTVTDINGFYSLEAAITVGDLVTVTFGKEGFTTFSKTLDTSGTTANVKRQYVVNGKAAQTSIIVSTKTGDVFKAGGGTGPGFRFGLMRTGSGVQRAFASGNEVRRAASSAGKPELDINIPATWAPGATAISAKLATFDPSLPTDRAMFPGEFVGIGGATAATGAAASKAAVDQTAYQLESVSFFSADVTPNTGDQLVTPARARAAGASKAAVPGNALIYKRIPADGCLAIQKYEDRDAVTAGVQVPLYTYKSSTGKWGYLGEGTLAVYNSLTSEYDVATVVDATTSLANLACSTTDYYFAIETADWTTWWNLDYPILLEAPKTVTLCGTVVDQNTNPVPNAYVVADGYAKGQGANSYHYAYASANGKFEIEILTGTGKELSKFDFAAYDYSNYPYASSKDTNGSFPALPASPITTGCNEIGNVVVPSTSNGRIDGTLLEELTATTTQPLKNQSVWVESLDYSNYYYKWTQTDEFGKFSMKAPLNQDLKVTVLDNSYPVTIGDGAKGFEDTELNDVVTLKAIKRPNSAPEVSAWISPNPAKANKSVSLSAWARDPEGDAFAYEWFINSVSFSNTPFSQSSYSSWTPPAAGNYTVDVTVTDSRGKAKTVSQNVSVAPADNSLPVIYDASIGVASTCGGIPTITVNAYDPDGDPLTYSWANEDGSTLNVPPLVAGVGTPAIAPTGSFVKVTVSDGKGSVSQNISVPAANLILLYNAYALPQTQTVNNAVQLLAFAYSGTTPVTYLWAVTDPVGNVVPTTANDEFTPTMLGEYSVQLTATGCGSVRQNLPVNIVSGEFSLDPLVLFASQAVTVNKEIIINLQTIGQNLPAGAIFLLEDLTEPNAITNGSSPTLPWTPTVVGVHTLQLTVTYLGLPLTTKSLDVQVNPAEPATGNITIQ